MAEKQQDNESETWQVDKSVVECNDYMFTHQVACDVRFHICHPEYTAEDVSAHKYVLISRSPVFYAMLCGDWCKGDIDIVDIDPSTFKMMLRFLYTDQINLNAEEVFAVMYAAKKYMLPRLIACCSKFLSEVVNNDNVCIILNQSLLLDAEDLQVTAMKFIEENTDEVAESEAFLNLRHDAVLMVAKSDDLSISEVGVINAVYRWVEDQCKKKELAVTKENKRCMLGDVLNELRFHTLSAEELSVCVSGSDVLDDSDIARVFRQIYQVKTTVPNVDVKSARKSGVYWVKGVDGFPTRSPTLQVQFLTQVQTDKHIEIHGLRLENFTSTYTGIAKSLNISIIDKSNVCINTSSVQPTDTGDGHSVTVALPEPVRVTDGIFTINVTYNTGVNPNQQQYNQYHYQQNNISFQSAKQSAKCRGVSFEFKTAQTVLREIQFKRVY